MMELLLKSSAIFNSLHHNSIEMKKIAARTLSYSDLTVFTKLLGISSQYKDIVLLI